MLLVLNWNFGSVYILEFRVLNIQLSLENECGAGAATLMCSTDANAMKKILLFLHPSSLLTDEVVAA